MTKIQIDRAVLEQAREAIKALNGVKMTFGQSVPLSIAAQQLDEVLAQPEQPPAQPPHGTLEYGQLCRQRDTLREAAEKAKTLLQIHKPRYGAIGSRDVDVGSAIGKFEAVISDIDAALAAAPQPPAQPEYEMRESTREEMLRDWQQLGAKLFGEQPAGERVLMLQAAALLEADAQRPAYQGPKKFTQEEIEDGERGIRWVTNSSVGGRPTEHDVVRYLKIRGDDIKCGCAECVEFYLLQPAMKPLTYVDLRRIASQCGLGANEVSARTQATVDNFARAIEAAHGIKEQS